MFCKSLLRKKGKSETAKCKDRIQNLLREIAILRDKKCFLSNYPEAGQCGGYKKDGGLILQAEHLVSRVKNVSYGDTRNIVCICKRHHFFWKPMNSRLYWKFVEDYIGEKRWEWVKRVEADTKSYHMEFWDWSKVELGLIQELNKLKVANKQN